MKTIDFLHETGIFESKGDIRRRIQNKGISIDTEKVNLENDEINTIFNKILVIRMEEFLCRKETLPDLELFKRLCKIAGGIINFKKIDKLFEIMLRNIFIVHKGKKEIFLVIVE